MADGGRIAKCVGTAPGQRPARTCVAISRLQIPTRGVPGGVSWATGALSTRRKRRQQLNRSSEVARWFQGDAPLARLSASDAAAVLGQVPPAMHPLDTELRGLVQHALDKWTTAIPPAYLRRYRFWEPVYIHGTVIPAIEPAKEDPSVPLGFVCAGVLEIIDPSTVDPAAIRSDTTGEARFRSPASRKDERDRIEGVLFPGSAIGLFEATDVILERFIGQRLAVEHKGYAIFAGTRSIEPGVSANREVTLSKWIKKRVDEDGGVFTSAALSTNTPLDLLKVNLSTPSRAAHTTEYLTRLMMQQIYPTPWTTTVLYLSGDFFRGLPDDIRQLIVARAWQRMSATFERSVINTENHNGDARVRAEIMETARAAAVGIEHCYVPAEQCPEVLEGTGMAQLHEAYCKKSALYDEHLPYLLVPGYLRKPGDWGLISLRHFRRDMNERSFDLLLSSVHREVLKQSRTDYVIRYLRDRAHFSNESLPVGLRKLGVRELEATKQQRKFLSPSLFIRRV